MITVRLPKEIEERLDALAKAAGRTKTFYVREAEKRMEEIRSGRSKTIPLEDVMREYGLED